VHFCGEEDKVELGDGKDDAVGNEPGFHHRLAPMSNSRADRDSYEETERHNADARKAHEYGYINYLDNEGDQDCCQSLNAMNNDQGYEGVLIGGINAMHIVFEDIDDYRHAELSGEEPELIVNVLCPFKEVKLMAFAILHLHFRQ